ncbi:hypothetical protein CcaverHIS002_0108040 [Cutaneotrichosporon cavernicola]|nr:hypothetical protein CcaverHIS002_0108040 [Cutaneotrichosporon cavernicola]
MGWFRRVRGKGPKAPASEPAIPTHVRRESADIVEIHHADADGSSDDGPHPPLGAPGTRMATLNLSPSETNLYLQALAGLDNVNPKLPLWTEPAPSLPSVSIDVEPILTPNIPYPTTPDIIPALHPNRQNRQHGLLVLSGDSGVQLTGFPAAVVPEVDAALQTWKSGVAVRSDELEDVVKRHPEMPVCWKAELKGKVWRLKGTQELESIRLLLVIFSALAHHGYTMVGTVQPAVSKPESHNLLFTYTPNVEEVPPLFFAVTLPLPDRISLVNPPQRLSSQLLASIRSAITNLHRPPPSPNPSHFRAIKLEGWVHPGVYRFWLAGLRRWPAGAGGVRRDVIARLQPLLVLGITDAVKSNQLTFVGSVPLLPRTTARDVLIFSSTPESGLCHRDAYSEENERTRATAIINGLSTEDHTGRPRERNPSLIDRAHPVQSLRRSGGSHTSTDFYPGAHQSTSTSPTKPSLHRLQTQASYGESTFSRPSARTSLERERRISAERMSQDSRRPSHASQPPTYLERDRPSTSSTKVEPEHLHMLIANTSPSSSPIGSPSSPESSDSPIISYNNFLYHPIGFGPGSTHTNSGVLGLASTPPPSLIGPRRLSTAPKMVYPPLSPGYAAEGVDGQVPLLSIDTDSVSARSRYSRDSPPRDDDDDEWNPEPPNAIKSSVSDKSSVFVTPPSSPGPPVALALPQPLQREWNAAAQSACEPLDVTCASPPPPSRSPHRLPPIAAAHRAHWPYENGEGHDEAVYLINRDRAAMLSRGSVMSEISVLSTTSSRPAGVGSTRTRVNLTMTKE